MTAKLHLRSSAQKSKKKWLTFLVLFFLSCSWSSGQNLRSNKPLLRDRLIYGGSFSLQIGTYTDIEVSPVFGIWLLPRIAIAGGPDYRFYKDPWDRTDIYGGRIYLQYIFIQDINNLIPIGVNTAVFLHAEYEGLSLESDFWKNTNLTSKRFMTNTMLGGVGINQPVGARSSINFMVLWALTNDDYGVYNTPEIRVGLIF